jgi:ribosome-associated heat shock protein Hsp15
MARSPMASARKSTVVRARRSVMRGPSAAIAGRGAGSVPAAGASVMIAMPAIASRALGLRPTSAAARNPIRTRRSPSCWRSRSSLKPTPRSGAEARLSRELDRQKLNRQRIDKWLWHARVVRTRSAAAGLASAGYVRVNGSRIDAAGRAVRIGDVITIALDRNVRVLKVADFAARRGSSDMARALYVELTPAASGPSESRRSLANAPSMR